jgi:hypothetical protein
MVCVTQNIFVPTYAPTIDLSKSSAPQPSDVLLAPRSILFRPTPQAIRIVGALVAKAGHCGAIAFSLRQSSAGPGADSGRSPPRLDPASKIPRRCDWRFARASLEQRSRTQRTSGLPRRILRRCHGSYADADLHCWECDGLQRQSTSGRHTDPQRRAHP